MVEKVTEPIKDSAFLLRSVSYGDHHRILHFLTLKNGRVDLIALGAKKSQKRFSSLDFLHCLKIEYRAHRHGGLATLLHCELEEDYGALCRDYETMMIALHWLRLLAKVLPEGQNIVGVFHLLHEALRALPHQYAPKIDVVFLRRLLAYLGFHLELRHCIRCLKMESSGFFFVAQQGGILCRSCHPQGSGLYLRQALPSSFWQETEKQTEDIFLLLSQRILAEAYFFYLGISLNTKVLKSPRA